MLALWNSNWAFLALGYSKKFIRLTAGTSRLIRHWQRGSDGDQTQPLRPIHTHHHPPPAQLPKSNLQRDPPLRHSHRGDSLHRVPLKFILSKNPSAALKTVHKHADAHTHVRKVLLCTFGAHKGVADVWCIIHLKTPSNTLYSVLLMSNVT